MHEQFLFEPSSTINWNYINLRKSAASLKKQYIEQGNIEYKQRALSEFGKAEEIIEDDYAEYSLPNIYVDQIKKIDAEYMRYKRRYNVKFLANALISLDAYIATIRPTDKDVPLFLPILVKNKQRDQLRKFLIQNQIYCPVHWPLSTYHPFKSSDIYNNCLSLICDQRYNLNHMQKIVELIFSFYSKK